MSEIAVQYALQQIGKPYMWAKPVRSTKAPRVISSAGYDCSGLTWAAYRAAGIDIGFVTFTQIKDGTAVSRENLARGDLVFPDPGHVQIYLGNGQVVHSPRTGSNVQISTMKRFYAGRRVSTGGIVERLAVPGQATKDSVSLKGAIDWLTDTKNWLRLGMIVLGGVLIGVTVWPTVGKALK